MLTYVNDDVSYPYILSLVMFTNFNTRSIAINLFPHCICFIVLIAFTSQNVGAQNKDEVAIRSVLSEQAKAWNNGDIDGYMKGYWNSDSLLFIGKSGPKYGYQSTLVNYKNNYPDRVAMGKLTFDSLQFKSLSQMYSSVVGKWLLKRAAGDAQGYFTLLFKKIENKWLIIMDHSS